MYKENELSPIGKSLSVLLLVGITISSIAHALYKDVPHPGAFLILCLGFFLFLISKLSVIRRGKLISFGTTSMTENMGIMYRLGYWVMIMGFILTFNYW